MASIFFYKTPSPFGKLFYLLAVLLITAGCSETTLEPPASHITPVETVDQLAGLWTDPNVYANVLPATSYAIPAFSPGAFNARMLSYNTDLVISVTGNVTGLFSTISSGTAADTLDPFRTAYGSHRIAGSFSLGSQGAITVVVGPTNPESDKPLKYYDGQVFLAGDTLILNFTLFVPPEKSSGFLPDTTAFIARLVKQLPVQ
ncbi:MAG: hypothetical protein U9P14_02770 [Gemmatimonadota bacterium]|nr:hypothetical protein [Gemmatimonadota bacterium]